MRKLREAAVVAAVLGSVTMLGAGVASAGGWEPSALSNLIGNSQTSGSATGGDAAIITNGTGGGGNN